MSSLHVSLRVEPGSLYRVSVGSSEGIYEVSAVVDIVVSVAMVLQRKVGFPFISDDSSFRSNKLQDQQAECVCVSRVVRTFYQEAFAGSTCHASKNPLSYDPSPTVELSLYFPNLDSSISTI